MIEQAGFAALGLAAGILGSMIGLGGGIVVVPALTILGVPPVTAASNSLFVALSNAAASTVSYSRQKRIDYGLGLRISALSVPGTILGALLTTDSAPWIFKALFGALLVAAAAYIALRSKMEGSGAAGGGDDNAGAGALLSSPRAMTALVVGASFFAGTVSSFFGIGGGVVFIPLMVAAMGIGMVRAAPTSQFALLFTAFSGIAVHWALGNPDVFYGAPLMAGVFAGGLIGAKLSAYMKERWLRILASSVILGVSVKLFHDAIAGWGEA